MITRRRFMAALAACAAAPDAIAQTPGRVVRVGWLALNPTSVRTTEHLEALRDGLRERGWLEGRNLVIDARFGLTSDARALAAEIVRSQPNLIVTQGPMVFGARAEAGSIPIVFGFSGDPVEAKLVGSLARPNGTLTGMTFLALELVGKRLELLKEALPALTKVAILANPQHPGEQAELRASQTAAGRLGIGVQYAPVRTVQEFEAALQGIERERCEAIVVFPDGFMMNQSRRIAAFALRHRIPAVSGWGEFAAAGNVMTYGPDLTTSWRQIATYVDKILRGARPGDIPVEQASKVELVVNPKAAQAIGLTLPPSILLRADRLID